MLTSQVMVLKGRALWEVTVSWLCTSWMGLVPSVNKPCPSPMGSHGEKITRRRWVLWTWTSTRPHLHCELPRLRTVRTNILLYTSSPFTGSCYCSPNGRCSIQGVYFPFFFPFQQQCCLSSTKGLSGPVLRTLAPFIDLFLSAEIVWLRNSGATLRKSSRKLNMAQKWTFLRRAWVWHSTVA